MGRNKKKKNKTAPNEGGADNATACVCPGNPCSGNKCSGESFRHILRQEREGKRRLTQPVPFDQAPISYESSDPRTSKGVKVFGDSSCVSLGLRIVQEENTVHLPVFGVPVPFHFAYIHRVYTESTGRDGTLNLYVLFKYCPNRPLQFVKELVFKSKNLGNFAWTLQQSVKQYQAKHPLPEEPKPLLPREALRAALKVSDDPIDDSFSQYIFRQPQPQEPSEQITKPTTGSKSEQPLPQPRANEGIETYKADLKVIVLGYNPLNGERLVPSAELRKKQEEYARIINWKGPIGQPSEEKKRASEKVQSEKFSATDKHPKLGQHSLRPQEYARIVNQKEAKARDEAQKPKVSESFREKFLRGGQQTKASDLLSVCLQPEACSCEKCEIRESAQVCPRIDLGSEIYKADLKAIVFGYNPLNGLKLVPSAELEGKQELYGRYLHRWCLEELNLEERVSLQHLLLLQQELEDNELPSSNFELSEETKKLRDSGFEPKFLPTPSHPFFKITMGDSSRVGLAKKKIVEDPYDVDAWQVVLKDASSRSADEARPIYEQLITFFPTSGKFWKLWIDHEVKYRNYEQVEKIFPRCLTKVLSLELWKTYLNYVKETKISKPDYKEKMARAYDFALALMGMDINSFPIWNDYAKFLKGVEVTDNHYSVNQKISLVRRVYQRGVEMPIIGIEQLWNDYSTFEKTTNPILAEKMLERSRDYIKARRVAKEFEAIIRGINKTAPCVPPTGSAEEKKQVELWQKYLLWEKSNPLKSEDQKGLFERVKFAYEQCLLVLGHHPNIWYEAAQFYEESARNLATKGDVDAAKIRTDETEAFYQRATSGIHSRSMLLHFAFADFQEQQSKYDKVHQIYTNLLESTKPKPKVEGEEEEEEEKDKFEEPKFDPTLCYIQYMKFCRRAEGTASSRKIFKKAREDPRTQHQAFVAAALMEYYCTKDTKIAGNVFELGFKKHKTSLGYVSEYIQYLSHLNEDNNTRVLFERALSSGSLSAEDSVDVWQQFLEFESSVGDLPGIVKIEKRRAQALDTADVMTTYGETARLIDRYKFKDLYPCSLNELRAMGYETNDAEMKSKLYPSAGASAESSGTSSTFSDLANSSAPVASTLNASGGANSNSDGIARPDTAQMIPFKPKFKWFAGEHRLPGGGFPLPQPAAELCKRIPPPDNFHGPFVIIDRLMESFMSMQLAKDFIVPRHIKNGQPPRLFETAANHGFNPDLAAIAKGLPPPSQNPGGGPLDPILSNSHPHGGGNRNSRERSHTPSDGGFGDRGMKRRRSPLSDQRRGRGGGGIEIKEEEDDNDSSISAVSANDIFRQRQQKKMR